MPRGRRGPDSEVSSVDTVWNLICGRSQEGALARETSHECNDTESDCKTQTEEEKQETRKTEKKEKKKKTSRRRRTTSDTKDNNDHKNDISYNDSQYIA